MWEQLNLADDKNKMSKEGSKILVVDDDPLLRGLVCVLLKRAGYEVIEADSGKEALPLIELHQPDLALLDVNMPEMSGLEVCAWLRTEKNDGETVVLMMTGMADNESIENAFDVGATDFIEKPFNNYLLRHRVHYLLRQKNINSKLRISDERLVLTQRTASLGHFESIQGDPIIYLSSASTVIKQTFGSDYQDGEILKEKFFERVDSDDIVRLLECLDTGIKTGEAVRLDFKITGADGGTRVVFVDLDTVIEDGTFIKFSGVFQDITDRRKAENYIHQLSHFDETTGLPNRVSFKEKLAKKLAYAGNQRKSIVVFVLGIDNFRMINQSLGHAAGDLVLAEIAGRIERFIRAGNASKKSVNSGGFSDYVEPDIEHDLVGSLDGDQFSFALWGIRDEKEASWIVSSVMHLIKMPIKLKQQDITITCSAGITYFPLDGVDADTLLKNAETAMHHAKGAGRTYRFFVDSMATQSSHRLALQSDMVKALANDQFTLHYQPKVDIANTRVSGVEALIRWQHPDKGLIAPGEFIPIAEENGQILQIGEWVLEAACKQAKVWVDQGTPLSVSVNVSVLQLRDPEFCPLVSHMLAKYELDPCLIQLELVESMLMDSMDDNSGQMRVLRDLGVTIAIDDFGTGYSSMAYLAALPLDVLKIDKSFIDALSKEDDPAVIVEATIALAHALDLKVVAEGVEEAVQAKILANLGCDEIQGYLFSRPLSVDDFDAWLAEFIDSSNQASHL
ncbi:MAG: EAL domain-containing protein [Pseudomonadales bacterium]|nr:EAL domain-containing protein [Pseudomonadales bacterium]